MLVNDEAELMHLQPLEALGSLSSLACAGCFDTCKSTGLGSTEDGIPWSCAQFGMFCNDSIMQAAIDTSSFGPALTQANRDLATSMAVSLVRNDPSLQPPSLFDNVNWWLVGGVVLVGAMILKRI